MPMSYAFVCFERRKLTGTLIIPVPLTDHKGGSLSTTGFAGQILYCDILEVLSLKSFNVSSNKIPPGKPRRNFGYVMGT